MIVLTVYERIDSAIGRCGELVEYMSELDTEYQPKEVRSVVAEYKWTVKRILSLCTEALESDDYAHLGDLNIKTKKIYDRYSKIDKIISKIKRADH